MWQYLQLWTTVQFNEEHKPKKYYACYCLTLCGVHVSRNSSAKCLQGIQIYCEALGLWPQCVTGHTFSGLDNVEVGRQQLYTANLTDTYRGGSSVSSRICPQGC
jgi:hypothetical protein